MEQELPKELECLCESGEIRCGSPQPWGAHLRGDGVNFAVFSRHATGVRLEFYDDPAAGSPSRQIDLSPPRHRTGDVWHVWVQHIAPGQLYAYRVDGPYRPEEGHRFNPHKLLLDPYATAIAGVGKWDFAPARGYDGPSSSLPSSPFTLDDAASTPKCVLTHQHFDWHGDCPPKHSASDAVIYETHVRGCTIHPSAGAAYPGTFRGLIEKIPYFRQLGVTAIELMPVQEFNEDELLQVNPLTGERLRNYWGYNPVAFFAPSGLYCSWGSCGHQTLEFREMVKAFHRAGIEIFLDIVLNHTAEGNELGPTICFRGIDNSIFYILQENDRRRYQDFTGVGNTLNANHPVVRDYVIDVLRYWVMHMHVDGFRFDLASVLGRDEHGNVLSNAPLLERIAEDPILRDVKIIAEAWDAGGAYQVGSFSESRWAEWNGRFRDDVRRFWSGERAMIGPFASRICGSSDLYERSGKGPECSVNFITSHDGFTLNDLVTYKHKHNEANGDDNHDGSDANYSDNCGIEGPTSDPAIEALRKRLIKNYLLTLFVSRGVPMLLGGDEFRRTQQGNNNAYCQDNEISWYDWSLLEEHSEVHRFARAMIAFRRAHPALRKEEFYRDSEIRWCSPEGKIPEWSDPEQKSLACLIFAPGDVDLFLIFNAANAPVEFAVPAAPGSRDWYLAVDTFRAAPEDFRDPGKELSLRGENVFRAGPRSGAILVARS
ncbi:MAG TPA: glycogen debranching protein GlgX [Candidatus Polarisedimenticolia bacterium]|nr:glycogen debranching protein GlgX [Candidatus Polarisedimenticolia bacterium]